MQIAIFSDIHGNLPALEAVLNDIKLKGIEQKFCLGDLVDFAPWGNEVIEKIREENILCLMGNHDERIAFDIPVIPLSKHSEEETTARILAIDHSKQHISKNNKTYLSQLPFHIKLNYKIGAKNWTIQLVHANLDNNNTYLYETESNEIFKKMLDQSQSDLIVMGHTHLSFKKQIDNKWAINCGSVGRSKEVNRLASYLILTINETELLPEIVQISYPLEKTANAIEKSNIPDFYANFLRNKTTTTY